MAAYSLTSSTCQSAGAAQWRCQRLHKTCKVRDLQMFKTCRSGWESCTGTPWRGGLGGRSPRHAPAQHGCAGQQRVASAQLQGHATVRRVSQMAGAEGAHGTY